MIRVSLIAAKNLYILYTICVYSVEYQSNIPFSIHLSGEMSKSQNRQARKKVSILWKGFEAYPFNIIHSVHYSIEQATAQEAVQMKRVRETIFTSIYINLINWFQYFLVLPFVFDSFIHFVVFFFFFCWLAGAIFLGQRLSYLFTRQSGDLVEQFDLFRIIYGDMFVGPCPIGTGLSFAEWWWIFILFYYFVLFCRCVAIRSDHSFLFSIFWICTAFWIIYLLCL